MISTVKTLLSRKVREDLRTPLKAKPLRFPGQSLDEEIERLLRDKGESYAIVGAGLAGIFIFEWSHVLLNARPMPVLISTIAAAFIAYAFFRLIQLRGQIRNLRLGRDGERVFGQFLDDELRRRGHYVLHDVVGGKWNVDHIVIGQRGIYTIETKTRSKPRRGRPVVHYDGQVVTVNGRAPDRDPVAQAIAQAAWLRETLSRGVGLDVHVQPIVAFPGWYIESPKNLSPDVWVLSGKELPGFIENSRQSLDGQTVKTIRSFLKQMVRSEWVHASAHAGANRDQF